MPTTPRLLALSATVAFTALVGVASAAGPTVVAGNPSCSDIDPTWSEVKLDTGKPGTHDVANGALSATITIDAGGKTASFTAHPGVDAVLVKYGTDTKVYAYDPDATSGTVETDGQHAISHISLCHGPDAPPPATPDANPDTQPDPSATPGAGQPPQPQQQSQPQLQVLGETATGGRVLKGRSAIHGPSSCVSKAFTVRVTGRRIAKVTFKIDGRSVKSSGRALRVDPGRYGTGTHRVEARVRYAASSTTKPRTHRFVFQRCARQAVAPQFTG